MFSFLCWRRHLILSCIINSHSGSICFYCFGVIHMMNKHQTTRKPRFLFFWRMRCHTGDIWVTLQKCLMFSQYARWDAYIWCEICVWRNFKVEDTKWRYSHFMNIWLNCKISSLKNKFGIFVLFLNIYQQWKDWFYIFRLLHACLYVHLLYFRYLKLVLVLIWLYILFPYNLLVSDCTCFVYIGLLSDS